MTDLPDDPTLDEVRAALAPLIAHHAAFDGWRATAVDSAARQAGIDTGLAPSTPIGAGAMRST